MQSVPPIGTTLAVPGLTVALGWRAAPLQHLASSHFRVADGLS
jgi:hypothetical protein